MRQFLQSWLPVFVWMAIIFVLSADSQSYQHSEHIVRPFLLWLFPHMSAQTFETLHHIFRKCCHLTVYAVLGLLVFRALRRSRTDLSPWSWPRMGGTLLIIFLYACSDEYHQSFVPTRTPLFSDVCIDTSGAAFALLVLWFYHLCRKPAVQKNK